MNSNLHPLVGRTEAVCTPIADKLAKLRKMAGRSFHGLPLSGGASIARCRWRAKFEELFGQDYLRSDLTITGKYFDSLFFSEGVIHQAEELAARLYGADQTLFVTTGTTTSNQIAVTALCPPKVRALIDKHCHQSIHFTLNGLGARVDHLGPAHACEDSGRSIIDLDGLLAKILCAQAAGDPYELIVLTTHSYEGIIYNIPSILEFLVANGVTTRRFVIDEAWGAANYFHERLRDYGAMNVNRLASLYPGVAIVATQSAHKSMSCLRQASMIHFRGPAELGEKLRIARFRLHTTSPSYPILASLDLARAQMQDTGLVMMQDAVTLAKEFEDVVATDPELTSYRINRFELPRLPFAYADVSPMNVSLNVSELVASALEIRDHLYARHGIYVNRITKTSLLFNFHIGIDRHVVEELLAALRKLQRNLVPDWSLGGTTESFIVPYPPGVPLILPGEEVTPQLRHQLLDIARSGIRVFAI